MSGNVLLIFFSCNKVFMMVILECDVGIENDICKWGIFFVVNYCLIVCGLFFELFMVGVMNFNGIFLVLLQLFEVSE